MTREEAISVAQGYLGEYARLCEGRSEGVASAARRIGISRSRWYQIVRGQGTMSLANFLTLLAEIDRMKAA